MRMILHWFGIHHWSVAELTFMEFRCCLICPKRQSRDRIGEFTTPWRNE